MANANASNQDAESLIAAVRDHLSPHAVALIIAKLQPVYGKGDVGRQAEREVAWLVDVLTEAIGAKQGSQLFDEVGV